MSSRRKSSVPCMVRVNADPLRDQEGMEVELLEDSDESAESSDASQRMNPEDPGSVSGSAFQTKRTRSFTCKYCPFSSPNLSRFKEHVDSEHPNVILNPRYLCTVCNFSTNKFDSLTVHNLVRHPGETNFKFKRLKTKHQTVLEQTVEGPDGSVKDEESTERLGAGSVFPATVKTPESLQALYKQQEVSQLDHLVQKDQITAVTINGTVIIPEPAFLRGLSHVAPLLQRPPNFQSVPKVAVPLNTTKYNPSLDHNATLITSFNRFPYPTHAELSWLTAASKHPEEQIRIWFTTQRLKQGITWSPEEVEEARKKMFNGSVPPAHHAFAVLPAAHESSQQPLGPTVRQPTTTPTPLVAGGASSAHKRAHLTTIFGPEPKRPPIIHSIRAPLKAASQIPCFPPDAALNELQGIDPKASYSRREAPAEANGASDCKWPGDLSSPAPNNGITECGVPKADLQQKSSVLTQFPLLERMKGKTAEQLKVLEEYFLRNSFPSQGDVDHLAGSAQLSPQEIGSWFVERRALRDNLEQALLSSMGAKRAAPGGLKMKQQLNGTHKPGAVAPPPPLPPDCQSLTLLRDSLAQNPWPSPEELSRLECRTAPPRSDLPCWFPDGRLYSGSTDPADHFHKNRANGGQGPLLRSSESPPSLVRRGQEGGVANGSGRKMLEAEFGWGLGQRSGAHSARTQIPMILWVFLVACSRAAPRKDLIRCLQHGDHRITGTTQVIR
uniref:Zinc fingers and homeoboxes 2 n=1 Tax=Takifugu rubripes TaxID=31033 RepID=A0A674N6E9_TAKRU